MNNRSVHPPIRTLEALSLDHPNLRKLDNQVEVAFFNLGSQDVIHVELVFKSGLSKSVNNVIPTAVSELLGSSSLKYSSGEIAEKIDYYGAFLESSINMDMCSVSIYCLTPHLKKVLEILKEALNNIVFEYKDLEVFLSNSAEKLKAELERVEYVCLKEFNKLLFANHPYGNSIGLSDFKSITPEVLTSFKNDCYGSNNLNIIVSGRFDEQQVYDSLNDNFGTWKKEVSPFNCSKLTNSAAEKRHVLKAEAVQSAIRIGKIIPVNYGGNDYFNLKILTIILGGYFGSRLMGNLREEKGLTYGVNSSLINYDGATFMVISTTVKGDATRIALNEIYKEIALLTCDLIPENELKTVKNYISGSMMKTIDGPFLVAEQYKLLNHKGEKLSHLQDFYAAVNKCSSEELLQIAKKYFSVSSFSELVVGPSSNN